MSRNTNEQQDTQADYQTIREAMRNFYSPTFTDVESAIDAISKEDCLRLRAYATPQRAKSSLLAIISGTLLDRLNCELGGKVYKKEAGRTKSRIRTTPVRYEGEGRRLSFFADGSTHPIKLDGLMEYEGIPIVVKTGLFDEEVPMHKALSGAYDIFGKTPIGLKIIYTNFPHQLTLGSNNNPTLNLQAGWKIERYIKSLREN